MGTKKCPEALDRIFTAFIHFYSRKEILKKKNISRTGNVAPYQHRQSHRLCAVHPTNKSNEQLIKIFNWCTFRMIKCSLARHLKTVEFTWTLTESFGSLSSAFQCYSIKFEPSSFITLFSHSKHRRTDQLSLIINHRSSPMIKVIESTIKTMFKHQRNHWMTLR